MQISMPNKSRDNNFGVMRLFFAILVIVSHSFELIDGNRSREPLTKVFGTLSFGQLAVDGFFLISGFLISISFVRSKSISRYLLQRCGRIIPAFVVCFVFCLLVIVPIGGGNPFQTEILFKNVVHLLELYVPIAPDAFVGYPQQFPNGALWTIGYEFRCYLFVIVLGVTGLLTHRRRYLVPMAALLLILNAFSLLDNVHIPLEGLFGFVDKTAWLLGVYLVGVMYNVYGDRIKFTNIGAVVSAALLIVCLFYQPIAEAAVCIFGGYIIFWFSFTFPPLSLSRRADSFDISYGMYLYAWPVQKVLIWWGMINPWAIMFTTILIAGLLAAASWKIVEEPFKKMSHRKRPSTEQPLIA